MSYLEQLETDKFETTLSGVTAVRIKIETAGGTGIPSQHSVNDREKAKFTEVNGKAAVKVVLTT